MPCTIGKCKLFRIKHVVLLEGETFLRNKHDIAFLEIKCTFCGRKENTINETKYFLSTYFWQKLCDQVKLPKQVSQKKKKNFLWESTLNCNFCQSSIKINSRNRSGMRKYVVILTKGL